MKRHLLLTAALSALVAPGALAQERIVVTATRGAMEAPPVSVTTLERDDLAYAPAGTIEEVLRSVPGVQLPLTAQGFEFPANPSVAIRGLGLGDNGTRTLVLIDGVPANGGFFGNVYWGRAPLDGIERVEVVRGGGSGLYGSFAQGGVISLITRAPGAESEAFLEARGGELGTYGADASLSGPLSERMRGGVSASYGSSDGFIEVVESQRGPIDQKSSYENAQASGRLTFDLSDRVSGFVRAGYFDGEQHGTTSISRTFTNVGDASAGLTAHLSDSSRLSGVVFFQDEEFQTFNAGASDDRTEEFLTFTSISGADDVGGSLVWTQEVSSLLQSIAVGADARRIDGDNDAQTFTPEGDLFKDEQTGGVQRSVGLFAEAIFSFGEGNEIVANVRADFFRNGDAHRVENGVAADLPSKDIEEVSFRLAAEQEVAGPLSLRAAVYRSFRAPTLAELYRDFGTASFQGIANPLLDAETLLGGEVGAVWADDQGRRLEVTYFRNTIEDFIGGVPIAFDPVFTIQNENLGETRTQGVEAIGEWPVTEHLSLTGSYLYLDGEVTENPDDPELVGNRVENTPEHTVTAGMRLSDWRGFTIDVRGRHMTDQYQDVGNESHVGGNTVFDASASYAVNEAAEVFLSATNVLDEDYEASAFGGLIQRGQPRTALVGVRLRY
jgi:outer membrane receptor protein involved in Fe transport